MRHLLFLLLALGLTSSSLSQSLPIDFEMDITTDDFEDFSGGTASVIANPYPTAANGSETVAQIVRDGGEVWAGSKILLSDYLDFTSINAITMKVYTTAPIGTVMKLKLEGDANTERDVTTTVRNEWETLTWDFTGEPPLYKWLVFMFDFGNLGDGSETSIFLFDDVGGLYTGQQIDHPANFDEADINYTTTDFGGNISSLVEDPEDASNTCVKVIKTDEAATWSGTTIGTPAGFANAVPLTLTDSKMTVRVWSPESGTPIRLKVEDSNDPTHTCETETNTTVAGEWEVMAFDFSNQAPGTELLSIGVERNWYFNMASIFMDFGTEGASVGEKTYYFDDVSFGDLVLSSKDLDPENLSVYPNPSARQWHISSPDHVINHIDLFNIQGQYILSVSPRLHKVTIDNTSLANGSYVAKIDRNHSITTLRLIKE